MSSESPTNGYDAQDAETEIAVVGMAGRFPGAPNLAQFWDNIANGVESITRLSDEQLAAAGVPESIRRAPEYVPWSSQIEDADTFDAEFFGYSPREAALLDPQARLSLELAWHALEDAGCDAQTYDGAIAVFATASLNTYLLQNLAGRFDWQDFVLGLGNIPVVLGNGPDFVATRLSYKLNLRGPSQTVQTACSSSLMAIHLARQSLLNGECDAALAGGVSIYLPQDRGYRWQEGMILSSDGHCRAFDAAADGIVFGRGGGMVVLKTVARALEDGDRIRAIIKGSAANNDGARKVGYTAPSVNGQSRVITEALADAGVRADSISYVEAHGTGTTLGDPIEIAGLTEAYRKHTARTGYCAIGTVKTNIGHLDVAAGVTAFIKTVLMLEHRQLAPSLHFTVPNPAIDFAASPFVVNTTLRPWDAIAGRRRAGVSAFGIGGTNVHLILEEAVAERPAQGTPRPAHIMRVTARTDAALATLCGDAARALAAADAPSVTDMCFTANVGRTHHDRRLVVRGTSGADLAEALGSASRHEDDPRVVRGETSPADPPPVAFLFTGLGAQMAGMGGALFENEPVFRAALEKCDALLRPYLERPLLSVIYPRAGESSPIDAATYGQPVMFAFEYALAELWKSWGVRPAAVLGHSLGEYAGSTVAGLLPLEEGLRLVSTRARLADTLPPGGGMAAAFATEAEVREAIGPDADRVWIASINGPQSMVMSGAVDALHRVSARLAERKLEARMLNVTQAFHSAMLDPILDEYEQAVALTKFGRAEIPIISNVTGGVMTDADSRDPRYWRRHAREVVRYVDGVRTLYDRGIRHFLEIGPHTTATAMAAGCVTEEDTVFLPSLRRGRDDYDQIFETLSSLYVRGVDVDWSAVHRGRPGRRTAFPMYPFERVRHWIDVPSAATVAAARLSPEYPMLGADVRSPLIDAPVYEVTVDPGVHAFLRDHRVFGATMFPATAYVEAAVEADRRAHGSDGRVVEDLEIVHGLLLDGSEVPRAQIVLRADGDGVGFEMFSESADAASGGWKRHAGGRLRARTAVAAPNQSTLDLDAIRSRCTASQAGELFYAGLAQQGFEYGPMFSGITRVWRGEAEILASVTSPNSLHGDGPFTFHPALLDACLQAALGLAPPGRTFLPLRIDRLDLRGSATELFAHAVRRSVAADARAFVCDIRVANADGEIIATAEGIALHEATSASNVTPSWHRWLYESVWEPAEAAQPLRKRASHAARRWLIVGDGAATAGTLGELAAARGLQTHTVSAEEMLRDASATLGVSANGVALSDIILVADGGSIESTHALLSCVQALARQPELVSPRLWIMTKGAQGVIDGDRVDGVFDAPAWGLANVVSLEYPEFRCACVDVDATDRLSLDGVATEIAADTAETRVALRGSVRYVQRLKRARNVRSASSAPMALAQSAAGELEGLRYTDVATRSPQAGEVAIAVRAAGVNFKDVLTALGRFPVPAAGIGYECAGEVTAVGEGVTDISVGDAVIAFAPGSLSTSVIADARLVAQMPSWLGFEAAATVAGGFLTAHYALHELARIGAGDRVLIHAATGGVGLAAVQLALRAGAEVFATAGSDAKRDLLRARGVAHVFSSRTPDFAREVMAATDGRGVTVVLNSLTGEMLERSVEILAPNGRFVELGMGSAMSEASRARFASDARYFNPNVAAEAESDPARFGALLRDVVAALGRREITPLPFASFDSSEVTSAFRLMARAGHIGKVVVRTKAGIRNDVRIVANGSYLIVGGLRGLGQLVAEWLADQGARHIAVMARREPSDSECAQLEQLRARGVNVVVIHGDVVRRADVDAAVARIAETMPRLRGVFHAAGILDDGVLDQQSWDRFTRVMGPKVAGAWNLHEALATCDLDIFVLFSSVASLLGSKGQGNHAAANAFLDSLAAHRRARGLPAVSINWGAWSDVGAAAERGIGERIAARGWGEIPPRDGLAALEYLLDWPRAQVGVVPIDWAMYARQLGGEMPPMLADVVHESPARNAAARREDKRSQRPEPATAPVAERVLALSPGERPAAVTRYVREQIGKVLGLAPTRQLDTDTPLVSMGLDSLLAVELRNSLNRTLGIARRLSATLLFDYPTLSTLSDHLLALIVESDLPAAAPPASGSASARAVPPPELSAQAIAEMTDEEAEALLLEELQ